MYIHGAQYHLELKKKRVGETFVLQWTQFTFLDHADEDVFHCHNCLVSGSQHQLQYFLKKPSAFGHLSQSEGMNTQCHFCSAVSRCRTNFVGMSPAQILPVIMNQNKFLVPHLVISCHQIMHFCCHFSFCLIKDIQNDRHFLFTCTHL